MARAAGAVKAPIYGIGDQVRVAARFPQSGHIRAPFYLRGKAGRVLRYYGSFYDPTALAQGVLTPPVCGLYQVLFAFDDVWRDVRDGDMQNDGADTCIVADIYDNWLEPDYE